MNLCFRQFNYRLQKFHLLHHGNSLHYGCVTIWFLRKRLSNHLQVKSILLAWFETDSSTSKFIQKFETKCKQLLLDKHMLSEIICLFGHRQLNRPFWKQVNCTPKEKGDRLTLQSESYKHSFVNLELFGNKVCYDLYVVTSIHWSVPPVMFFLLIRTYSYHLLPLLVLFLILLFRIS